MYHYIRSARHSGVSILKTVLNALRFGGFRIIACRKSVVRASKPSLQGTGTLTFGATWPRSISYPSQLIVDDMGALRLQHRSKICHGATVSVARGAQLQLNGCFINNRANIACYHSIVIGRGTVISENVTIRDDDGHMIEGRARSGGIIIGSNVWIGLNVTILKNVTIGDGAIVAAGAVVTKDVAPATLVGGNPARLIREEVSWS